MLAIGAVSGCCWYRYERRRVWSYRDIIVGIIGAVVGVIYLACCISAGVGLIGSIVTATVVAIILLFVIRLINVFEKTLLAPIHNAQHCLGIFMLTLEN